MFDYKKKFFLNLLFMLLLTLLLGSWSTCYAVEKGQIQNLAYNWYTNYMNWTDETTRQFITAKDSGFDNVSELFNSNYGIIATRYNSTEFYVYIVPNNYSTNNQQYISNNNYGWYIYEIGWIRFTSNSISSLKRNSVTGGRHGSNIDVVYTDFDIYNGNNSSSSIVYNAGYYTPSWFDLTGDYYSSMVWEFSPTSNSQTVTINGGNQWQYHAITGGWNIYLGSITDSEWVDKIQYRVGYWNNTLNQFSPVSSSTYTIYDYSKNGPLYKYWTSTNNGNTYTTGIYLDTYKYQNCVLQLVITSEVPNELTTIYYDYLITNSKTYINAGIFYPNLTFSGDYVQDYNNQTETNQEQDNTDNIIDSINDINDDSQVDDILDGYFSGDYNDMANQWGFNPFQNPYYDFLKSVLFGICDVLADQRNVTLDISFFGRSIILHSEDFVTPNNLITQFVKYVLIFFYLYGCFKFFYSVIISFETADIETIKQKIGTDEFYYKDGKYM